MNRLSGCSMGTTLRLINYRISRNLGKYQVYIRNAPNPDGSQNSTADAQIEKISSQFEKPKTIAEIRALLDEIENPQQDDIHTYNIEALGYIHMKDDRLSKVDPERWNYTALEGDPLPGDMDPATRTVYAKKAFVHRIWFKCLAFCITSFGVYAFLFSGFNVESEAREINEDPSYATIMLQNEKWKFAMEQYYKNRNEPIPWKSQSYEVKFSVPA